MLCVVILKKYAIFVELIKYITKRDIKTQNLFQQ